MAPTALHEVARDVLDLADVGVRGRHPRRRRAADTPEGGLNGVGVGERMLKTGRVAADQVPDVAREGEQEGAQ